MDLEEARCRIPEAKESREFQYCVWRSGQRRSLGTLHVLEPGVIIIDIPSFWMGVLCPPMSTRAVLSATSLMGAHIGGSFDIFDTSKFSSGTVGGDIKARGFDFWVDSEWNRDAYVHMMMTRREWEELRNWLRKWGLSLPPT